MNMPSVPKADIIAVAQAAIAAAVAFGAPLNADQQKSLLALAALVATILVTADVKRRANRLAAGAHKTGQAKLAPQAFATSTVQPVNIDWQPKPAAKKPAAKKAAPKKKP